jgi:plastocyanin
VHTIRQRWLILGVLGLSACGGGDGGTPGPSPTPNNPNRITIGSNGAVSPTELVVAPGSRVLFTNNDSRRHDVTSDPHPEHTDCQEINQVGLIAPNQSRETGNLVAVGTCGFHDHENPDENRLKGRIVVR